MPIRVLTEAPGAPLAPRPPVGPCSPYYKTTTKYINIWVFFGYFIVSRTHAKMTNLIKKLLSTTYYNVMPCPANNPCHQQLFPIVHGQQSLLIQSFTSIYKLVTSTVVVFCSNNIVITIVLCQHRATVDRAILINNIVNSSSVVEPWEQYRSTNNVA